MKSIEQLAEEFENSEKQRMKANKGELMLKGQRNGAKSRRKFRDIQRAFKIKKIEADLA